MSSTSVEVGTHTHAHMSRLHIHAREHIHTQMCVQTYILADMCTCIHTCIHLHIAACRVHGLLPWQTAWVSVFNLWNLRLSPEQTPLSAIQAPP